MTSDSTIQGRFRLLRVLLCVMCACLTLPTGASAALWRDLAQTERHTVALEMTEPRLNAAGKQLVWLRFIPRGTRQRREAAREYGNRNYQLHLEYYEIDCDEKSALLKLIDLLGTGGKQLTRLQGSGQPDAIIPDSVLDRAAQLICPHVEDIPADGDEEKADSPDKVAAPPDDVGLVPDEMRQRIENALRRAEKEPTVTASWIELGNAYFDADMPKKAIDAYDQALKLNPNDTNVLNDQGAMYRQSGDVTHALNNFEKALAVDPGNLESLYNRGYIYAIDLNRISTAREIWKRYLELDSTSETAEQVRLFLKHYEKYQDVH